MKKFAPLLVFLLALPLIGAAQGISQLQQFTATTSPERAITQTVFGKPLRLTGQGSGCAQFSANGTLTSTGINCGSGSSGNLFGQAWNIISGFLMPTTTQPVLLPSTLQVNGTSTLATTTTSSINGVIVIDGIRYAATGCGIKSAVSNAPSGSTVYVPKGDYSFTSGCSIAFNGKSIRLIGAGATTTRFISNGTTPIYDFYGSGSVPQYRPNIEIAGIEFDINSQSSQSAIQMGSSRNLYIHDNHFINGKNLWLVAIGGIGGTLGSETQADIDASASDNIRFEHNTVASSTMATYEGVLCINCHNGRVTGNYFANLTQGAATMALFAYNQNMLVSQNTFYNNAMKAMYTQNAEDTLISNNVIGSSIGGNQIYINNSKNTHVQGNQIEGTVLVSDASGAGFDGHIYTVRDSSEIYVEGNTFKKYYYGVIIPDANSGLYNQSDIVISGNHFASTTDGWSPISVGSTHSTNMRRVKILDNTASTSAWFGTGGIAVNGSTTVATSIQDVQISGNYITPSTRGGNWSAIYLDGVTNARLYDNYTAGAKNGSYGEVQITANTSGISQRSFTSVGMGLGTSTPGTLLSVQGIANFHTGTSTFYSSGGLNLTGGGCFAVSGVCINGGSSYSATYPVTLTGLAFGLAFGTTTTNTWSNLQTFASGILSQASSTIGAGGAATGLTISGGATTTGSFYSAGNITLPSQNGTTAGNLVFTGNPANSVNGFRIIHSDSAGGVFMDFSGASTKGIHIRANTTDGTTERMFIENTGWTYFNSNVNGGTLANKNGWALGWNKSSGDGESNLIYNTSAGGNPRLAFGSFTGSVYAEEMSLKGGKLGIGTTSPFSALHVTSGASATTTVTIGSIGLTSSKGCLNMNRSDGGPGSFYINAAGVMVTEPNYCR